MEDNRRSTCMVIINGRFFFFVVERFGEANVSGVCFYADEEESKATESERFSPRARTGARAGRRFFDRTSFTRSADGSGRRKTMGTRRRGEADDGRGGGISGEKNKTSVKRRHETRKTENRTTNQQSNVSSSGEMMASIKKKNEEN